MMNSWNLALTLTTVITNSIFLVAETANQSENHCTDQPMLVFKGESNSATLIGFFDIYEGPSCAVLRPGGFKQMLVPMWLADKGFDYIAYDTCSDVQKAAERLIYGLNSGVYSKTKSCEYPNVIGVLGPTDEDINYHFSNFLPLLGIPYFPVQLTSLSTEIEAVVAVLSELKWKQVALFFGEKTFEAEFFRLAKQEGICVSISDLVPSSSRDSSSLISSLDKVEATSTEVIIVLGSDYHVRQLLKSVFSTNRTGFYWILAGASRDNSDISLYLDPMDPVMIVQRTFTISSTLWHTLDDVSSRNSKSSYYNNALKQYLSITGECRNASIGVGDAFSKCYDKIRFSDPLVMSTKEAVDNFVEEILNKLSLKKQNATEEAESNDGDDVGIGANATSSGGNASTAGLVGVKKESRIKNYEEVKIWSYQHDVQNPSSQKLFEVGLYRLGKLELSRKKLNIWQSVSSGWFRIPEFYCAHKCDSVCLNKVNTSIATFPIDEVRYYLHFRSATWLTVALTVSCMGGLLSLILIVYLLIRTCHKGVTLDSHHGFSIVTLLAILFTYSCTLLFAFNTLSKGTRMVAVGLAYAAMFAPILARCFMIIAADMDGIPGHVSGLVQSVLCFFVTAVQVAITICYSFMNPGATFLTSKTHIIGYLSYTAFLGISWVIVSPFCARSHRGYREGLLIHIASVAALIVWIIWILMFFLLSPRWQDMVLCIGLVATASVILLLVFLPRVYRMVTSTAFDVAQVSLRPVALDVPSAQGHTTSIYESVNHGYNSDRDGFTVDMFRDSVDHPLNNKMTHL